MAFGSNTFPLGPNGEYPKQRVNNFNSSDIAPSNRVEDVYRTNRQSRLPVVERDFTSSLNKVQRKMKQGKMMREGQDEDKFRPRSAGQSKVKGDNWLRQRGNKFSGLDGLFLKKAKRTKRMGANIFKGLFRIFNGKV